MSVNKFGKLCGPGAESVPTANSVTTAKILDGDIAAADLGALSVTAAKLGVDVAGDGLAGGNGAAIALDIDNLTDAVIDVATDTLCFIDESAAGDPTKLESVADLVGLVAGTATATALTATDGVLTVAPTEVVTDVAADSVIIRDATDSKVHRDTIADVVTLMAGTATGTGLVATSGVLAVRPGSLTAAAVDVTADSLMIHDATDSLPKLESFADLGTAMAGTGLASTNGVLSASGVGIAHMANDDKASLFFIQGEIDFGVSAAVTQDLGALGAKGTLVGGYWYTTEAAANGDATNVITLGKATGGGTPIAGTRTITLANTGDGQSNLIGSMAAIIPVAAGVDMLSTDHVWLDIPDDAAGTRSAGKVSVFCIFQKSA